MTTTIPADVAGVLLRTRSAAQTRALGRALAVVAQPGDRIALLGPLGAGKTQLAKGFAAGLGVREVVVSPTFTLMAEYAGRLPLFHQDLYRLTDARDAWEGGLADERMRDGVTLAEWADRSGPDPDPARVEICIAVDEGDLRRLVIGPPSSEAARRYAAAGAAWRPTANEPDTEDG